MPVVVGTLGQVNPAAGVLTDLYTVPPLKNATARVIITNRDAAADSFRVSVAVGGAVDSLEQYIAYDKGLLGNDTGSTIGFNVNSGDIVRVRATLGTLSFTITGIEDDVDT